MDGKLLKDERVSLVLLPLRKEGRTEVSQVNLISRTKGNNKHRFPNNNRTEKCIDVNG